MNITDILLFLGSPSAANFLRSMASAVQNIKRWHWVAVLVTIIALTIPVVSLAEEPGPGSDSYSISGVVKDGATGDPLPWSTVYLEEIGLGAHTNHDGSFSLKAPRGEYTLRVSHVGYETQTVQVQLVNHTKVDFPMIQDALTLGSVVVTARSSREHIEEASMSVIRFNSETIKKIPALMGETDLLKSIQLMPGVQTGAEGFSGFSVRGGSTDQNLMLLDGATVYNASHLMGFFSVFNSDAINNISLYKGDIPARFGGRLASLVDVQMKEGNNQQHQGYGGIGTISSRLTLEGPISKGKSSYIISGRRTYADLFLRLSNDSLLNNNTLWFYDLNGKMAFHINPKNKLTISGYNGMDMFAFRNMMEMHWSNRITSVNWHHMASQALHLEVSGFTSRYRFGMKNMMGASGFIWDSDMLDHGLRGDLSYYTGDHTVRVGLQAIHHRFHPGKIRSLDREMLLNMEESKSWEPAGYISAELKVSPAFTLQTGLRLSGIMNVGEATVYHYNDNYTVIDTTYHKKGEVYHSDFGLEPRISAAYILNEHSSLKGSYSRTRQYVQPASNSTSGMPFDIWFPASPNVRTQVSDQVSVGYFRNLFQQRVEGSIELYAKHMDNQIDFKHNADIFFNEMIEGEIRTGIARAWGAELLLRKEVGRVTGWIGYTLSKVERQIDEVNEGRWYRAHYDKPHNLTLVVNAEASKRLSFGATVVYTTGAPITLPTGRWEHAGMIMPSYSERNGYRLPDYHRMDLSATIQLNRRARESRVKSELNISVYNVYNRKNPFTIFFAPDEKDGHTMQAYSLSMFGAVPSVTWNFRF